MPKEALKMDHLQILKFRPVEFFVCTSLILMGAFFAHQYLALSISPTGLLDLITILFLSPVLEELVFRALLQAGLEKAMQRRLIFQHASGHLANAFVAIIFALAHTPQHGWLAMWWIGPSLLLGELWRRHRLWWICAVAHFGLNASLLGMTYALIAPVQ